MYRLQFQLSFIAKMVFKAQTIDFYEKTSNSSNVDQAK